MSIHRRSFLQLSAAITGSSLLSGFNTLSGERPAYSSITGDITPISLEERKEIGRAHV